MFLDRGTLPVEMGRNLTGLFFAGPFRQITEAGHGEQYGEAATPGAQQQQRACLGEVRVRSTEYHVQAHCSRTPPSTPGALTLQEQTLCETMGVEATYFA